MTDKLRMLALLRERGDNGVHTSELRRLGYSGNPSQRRIELLDEGYDIASIRESYIGADGKSRPGARFILNAEPERPSVSDGPDSPLSGTPTSEPPATDEAPVADRGAEGALFAVEEPVDTDRYMDVWDDAA